jgi:hypothetical protein
VVLSASCLQANITNWRAVAIDFVGLFVAGALATTVALVGHIGAGLIGGAAAGYVAGGLLGFGGVFVGGIIIALIVALDSALSALLAD